jgi:hypothetical protein
MWAEFNLNEEKKLGFWNRYLTGDAGVQIIREMVHETCGRGFGTGFRQQQPLSYCLWYGGIHWNRADQLNPHGFLLVRIDKL